MIFQREKEIQIATCLSLTSLAAKMDLCSLNTDAIPHCLRFSYQGSLHKKDNEKVSRPALHFCQTTPLSPFNRFYCKTIHDIWKLKKEKEAN